MFDFILNILFNLFQRRDIQEQQQNTKSVNKIHGKLIKLLLVRR